MPLHGDKIIYGTNLLHNRGWTKIIPKDITECLWVHNDYPNKFFTKSEALKIANIKLTKDHECSGCNVYTCDECEKGEK